MVQRPNLEHLALISKNRAQSAFPAKAGIHTHPHAFSPDPTRPSRAAPAPLPSIPRLSLRIPREGGGPSLNTHKPERWIPAFAGNTREKAIDDVRTGYSPNHNLKMHYTLLIAVRDSK